LERALMPPCLILAAGFGTRMGALAATRPKPLIKVEGRSLLDRALDVARDAGAHPIAVNAHYRADQIAAHLAGQPDVSVLHETPNILDSGGAVKNALRIWPAGPVMTLNADNVWTGENPLRQLAAAFVPAHMGALLLLVPRAEAVGRLGPGDFAMDADGRLSLQKSGTALVYVGAQILEPAPIRADPREVFSLRDIWAKYQAERRLFGLIHQGGWGDVGHPEGLAAAGALLDRSDV